MTKEQMILDMHTKRKEIIKFISLLDKNYIDILLENPDGHKSEYRLEYNKEKDYITLTEIHDSN